MADFVTFDRAQAKAYFAEFLAEMEPCLDRLRSTSASTGGPSGSGLDLSPDSLGPLWEWARPRFAWREGYQPPAHAGLPAPRIEQVEPRDELPSWFHQPDAMGYERFSAETLWLIDGLGRYLGETSVRHIPGLSWRVGHSRAKHYVHQNHPVIAGLADEAEPFALFAVSASRVLTPGPRSPHTPADVFEAWRTEVG